ncbi:hypothetical protein CQW23_22883 [Capsicum baccatum]|uniref:F-box domain-containing protein n=1 Tax=Capsicum baccatum TaxID=33114 RepID=A0A2G2W253_CAPBA|nr:hypothetical protein CQW23_22883 [Capsicum baccatum]
MNGCELVGQLVELVGQLGTPVSISIEFCADEILALKSGSWRIIGKPTGIYSSWLSNMDSLAFVHGAFHWLGLSRNESVTSYDISNGVFKEIRFPDGKFVFLDMNCVKHGLSVLGEMICICSTHYEQWKYTFNLCIMKDYGVKESWNRFFTIQSTDLYSLVPEYRFSDGEVLLHCKHFDRCGYIFKTTKESSGFWPQSRSEWKRVVKRSKNMDVDGTMEVRLQEEIIMDILSRLPVLSLLRFKCVSKYWMTLISEPYRSIG